MNTRHRLSEIAGISALAAFAMTLNVTTAATAAPFTNGAFETPTVSGSFTTAPPATIAGWSVTGSVNHGTGPAQTTCPSGQCIDLNGNGPGAISQTFDTTCKPTYQVDFLMSRHVQLGATPAELEAWVDGVSKGVFKHGEAGVSAQDGKWKPHTFTFVANPSTTLAFKSKVMTGAAGPQIDNVRVKLISCT
jgi:hypothetical protein